MSKISIAPQMVFCPQPMYAIGTMNENDKPNFSVITWIGFNWNGSPHIMLGIGGSKRTKDNIIRTSEFSANLVSRDFLKLADYFGSTKGYDGEKVALPYDYGSGKVLNVPVLEKSRWVFECTVAKTIELSDSHIFVSEIRNIQIDEQLEDMNMEVIDLARLDPVVYAPYGYFGITERIGNCGDWRRM